MKSLVVFYSRMGTTRMVAEVISQKIGSDVESVPALAILNLLSHGGSRSATPFGQ